MTSLYNAFQKDAFQNSAEFSEDGFQVLGDANLDPLQSQVDQGSNYQNILIYRGPTIGWKYVEIRPIRNMTYSGSVGCTATLDEGTSVVLVNCNTFTEIILPDVVTWIREPHYNPFDAFDGSIWIKDISGAAFVNNIVVVPVNGQTVDKRPTITIVLNNACVAFYPLTDLSGWYVDI